MPTHRCTCYQTHRKTRYRARGARLPGRDFHPLEHAALPGRTDLFSTGLARKRIRVAPSPVVPASLFTETLARPDHPWFERSDRHLILGAGELCWRKDFETLLQAFARVRAERPCRLMILGRGGARDRLLTLAASLGVADDADLPGFVPNPYAFMAHADLFAFTSRWEGLGFLLIEALAVGTPVVATDCPSGPAEILHAGRYGPLVPVGDDASLAQAILATLDHPLPSETLRETARPYAIEAATDAYLTVLGLPLQAPPIDSRQQLAAGEES